MVSANNQPHPNPVPSSSTFSFKAPFPISAAPSASLTALKQRRVSLASPSSPRVVQPWCFRDEMGLDQSMEAASSSLASEKGRSTAEKKGKMRKVDPTYPTDDAPPPAPEKKPRKKWTHEETMMLVNGCQIHGVGNWKTILQDPNLKFQDRTAVDLKDRFRTYFPDAYKKHYPNAKTHLSNKIRSTFPDGTSLFEKTRSKRRRPFTEAEDAALKAGYEKHGTTWATIVKDPIFQEQNRRSTDLRDRFRNAFPHLYQAAGYKPRTTPKKKVEGPWRAADDNLSQMSKAGPVRSRRRAQSSTGYLRGGTKSVPQSTVGSEVEESSEDEEGYSPFKRPPTPPLKDSITSRISPSSRIKTSASPNTDVSTPASGLSAPTPASAPSTNPATSNGSYMETNDDMDLVTIETESLNIPDFMPNETHSELDAWSSGVNTPTHSSTAAWSIAGASPSSTHLSDFLLNSTPGNNASNASSPYIHRRNDNLGSNMIGKSAWGQDWFSPNPRLESSSAGSNPSSFIDNNFLPASPFSFHPHLNHGVLDRYDLFPPSIPNDISSDADLGDSHTTFSDDNIPGSSGVGGASSGGTGFRGYHSQIAGDLISGAGSRMQSFTSLPLTVANLYGTFGNSFGSSGNEILGLGLEGIPEDEGIHSMQFDAHTSDFSAIDELGITSISLNDNLDVQSTTSSRQHTGHVMDDDGTAGNALEMDYELPLPDKNQQQQQQQQCNEKDDHDHVESNILGDPFRLEDLVDMSNDLQHETPPATPIMRHSRPMRRSSQGSVLYTFDGHGSTSHYHARSTSVPPSDARNPGGGGMVNVGNVQMSVDDVGVGLHMHSQHHGQQPHSDSHLDTTLGKGLQAFFGLHSPVPSSSSPSNLVDRTQRHERTSERMRLSNSDGSQMQQPSTISSPNHHHQPQPRAQTTQPATLFPAQLMLTSVSASSEPISPTSTSHSQNSNHTFPQDNDPWRVSASASAAQTWINSHSVNSSDFYNVPYLDLHYTTYGSVAIPGHHQPGVNDFNLALDYPSETRQGQEALDLAQPASFGLGLTSMGLNLAFGTGSNGKSPNLHASTIRMPHLAAGMSLGKQSQPPSDTFGSVAAAIAAANAIGQNNRETGGGSAGVNTQDLTRTGTVRQSHFNSPHSGFGRSMSHHRGQSAVCPQDLELRNDNNKRKRASWDGGLG